jgi:lipoyl(octanoyl) transferase
VRVVDVAAPTLDPGPAREALAGGPVEARWLGRIAYRDAWALQHELVARRVAGEIPDQLLLLEHPAVLTLGRQSEVGHVRASQAELAARGIELIRVERGGEVTYHGPGQLVAYPILALSRRGLLVRPLVRALEAAMADTCAAFGVAAGRREGHPGCWCDASGPEPRKIGALGIRVERGVTYHGIALNVDPELADFELIDPCGMPGVVSTSIARELGSARTPSGNGLLGDAHPGITPVDRAVTLTVAPFPSRSDAPRDITGNSPSLGEAPSSGAPSPGRSRNGDRAFAGPEGAPAFRASRAPDPSHAPGPSDAPGAPAFRASDTSHASGAPDPSRAPDPSDAPDPSRAPEPSDAPAGIEAARFSEHLTHETGPDRADAPMGITLEPLLPNPSVERAARIFARALADHLGAELRGFAAEEPPIAAATRAASGQGP